MPTSTREHVLPTCVVDAATLLAIQEQLERPDVTCIDGPSETTTSFTLWRKSGRDELQLDEMRGASLPSDLMRVTIEVRARHIAANASGYTNFDVQFHFGAPGDNKISVRSDLAKPIGEFEFTKHRIEGLLTRRLHYEAFRKLVKIAYISLIPLAVVTILQIYISKNIFLTALSWSLVAVSLISSIVGNIALILPPAKLSTNTRGMGKSVMVYVGHTLIAGLAGAVISHYFEAGMRDKSRDKVEPQVTSPIRHVPSLVNNGSKAASKNDKQIER